MSLGHLLTLALHQSTIQQRNRNCCMPFTVYIIVSLDLSLIVCFILHGYLFLVVGRDSDLEEGVTETPLRKWLVD